MNELDDSSKLLEDIGSLESAITRLEASFKKLTESASSFTTTMRGGMGNVPGSASTAGTGGVGASGPNFLNQSLASVMPFMKMNALKSARFSILGGALQAVGGVTAGAFAAMPDVNAALGMASGNYYQGYMSGNNWRTVGSSTANFLGRGQNMVGASGVVSASLAAQGITFNGTKNNSGVFGGAGVYGSIAKSIGGAAQMMNVSNDVAAQSIGSMYSGATSMGLMQNFGVMTTNPNSGKSATPTQIFAMLNDRLTGGGRMSYKQVQTALGPGGALSLDIQNSGLDATGQQMLRSYMLSASQGKYLNFDNPNSKASQSAINAAGGNPLQAGMTVTAATNQTMQTAANSYVDGMNKATKAVVGLENALNNFLKSPFGKLFAQTTGAMNLAGKSTAVTGMTTAASGLVGGGLTALAGVQGYRGFNKLMKSLGGGAATKAEGKALANTAARVGGKAIVSSLGKAATKAVPVVGSVISGLSIMNDVSNNDWRSVWGDVGSIVGGAGLTAGVAAATGGLGLVGGAATYAGGAIAGNMGGTALYDTLFGNKGGKPTTVRTGSFGANNNSFKLNYPVKSKTITSPFGATGDSKYHVNGHQGVDFGVSQGTQVYAAADGTVSSTQFEYGYGQTVRIDHGNGFTTLYAHLSQASVSNGQVVTVGQPIALSGNTGAWTTGAHLHFGLYKGSQAVDPAPLLGGVAGFANATNGFNDVAGESGGMSSSSTAVSSGIATGAGSLGYSVEANKFATATSINGASSRYTANPGTMSGGSSIGIGRAAGGGGVGNSNTGGGEPGPGRAPANVQINVTVAQASESEARRLAQMVKNYLEEDTLTYSMGRM